MPIHHLHGTDDRFDRLSAIEQLLEQYRTTQDRRLLRRAIDLWQEVEAQRKLQADPNRTRIH
jgi:hypothetical protein